MKTATLTLNGKTYEVQLTDEQITEIEKPKKVTGFERANRNSNYFCANSLGKNDYSEELNSGYDNDRYENANYYTDISLAEWCIRNDTLNRKMRRWAAEHNDEPIEWGRKNAKPVQEKWFINYLSDRNSLEVLQEYTYMSSNEIYFSSERIAWEAVKQFGDEIKWLAENRPEWF